jgi:hypothetical protein
MAKDYKLRKRILDAEVVERGSHIFAGNKEGEEPANNHMSLDILLKMPRERRHISNRLAARALLYAPDLIVPIADGGNGWGEDIGELIRKPVAHLKKIPSPRGEKNFAPVSALSEGLIRRSKRLLIVDDVGSRLVSLAGVLRVPYVAESAVALVGIWNRGLPEQQEPVGIQRDWLIEEHIPQQLPPDSEYFRGKWAE